MSRDGVIVIGSGLSGLVAASLLAKEGLEVTVIEKERTPGGYFSGFEAGGCSFDYAFRTSCRATPRVK